MSIFKASLSSDNLPSILGIGVLDWLFLGLISTLFLIAPQFGIGNQVEQFSLVERILHPGFALGDIYVDSADRLGQPRYYYAVLLAGLSWALTLPGAVHLLMALTNFGLATTTFVAARQLAKASRLGASGAALLVVLNGSFSLGHAGYLVFDSYQPANLAIAAAFAAATCLLLGRSFAAVIGFSFAALIHPTIGVEIALISFAATGLTTLAFDRNLKGLIPLIGYGLAFLFVVALLWVLPNLGGHKPHLDARTFFEILAYKRAPHHYLGLGFPIAAWAGAMIFSGVTVAIGLQFHHSVGFTKTQWTLVAMALIVAIVCGLSLVLVDLVHNRIFLTAQVFRMVMVIKWIGCLGLGWKIGEWLRSGRVFELIFAFTVVAVSADAHPLAAGLVVLAEVVVKRLGLRDQAAALLAVCVLGLGLLLQVKFGNDKEAVRLLVASLIFTVLYGLHVTRPLAALGAVAISVAAITIAFTQRMDGLGGRESLRGAYSWQDHQEPAADIARKAAVVSQEGAVFLTPPDMEAFRLLSGRAQLVDFTSIPFEDQAMGAWFERMQRLYGASPQRGFSWLHDMEAAHAQHPDLEAAKTLGATYAVLNAATPYQGTVLIANSQFKVVKLK